MPAARAAFGTRYRLWELVSGMTAKRGRAMFVPVFEDSHAWKIPEQPLPYEYQTGIEAFVSDSEYNSSDDDDFDDELNKAGEAGHGRDFPQPHGEVQADASAGAAAHRHLRG